jgi:ankyrin repeat protein
MMCGSTEIDGYAFCLGLKSLRTPQKLSYIASPGLQSLPSLANLIERAGLRPKHITNLRGRYSLEIRSLAELLDMFHTRQASDSRDKVYALLGMSSDDPSKAGLQPNYEISWEELFQKLVEFILGKDVFVETSGQRAVIKTKGCILGQVSSVRRDDKQNVNIISRNAAWDLGGKIEWIFQASAKPIKERDVICLLHGASKPMIVRLCQDHFAIIVIAATPLNRSGSFGLPETSQLQRQYLRDFLLVWDWENPQGELQDQGEYETLTKTYSQALEYSKAESRDYLDKLGGLWNDIAILDDLREHKKADERLLEARIGFIAAFGKEHLLRLVSQNGRTLLSFAAEVGQGDVVKRLLETVDPDIKDGKSCQTPLWCAAGNGHKAIVKLLLQTGKVDADSKDRFGETPLSSAANNGHEAVVKLLLKAGKVNVDSRHLDGQTPLRYAARNGHKAVVKLLLQTGKVDADSKDRFGETPLSSAANNGHEAVVKLLLKTGKVNADSKDDNIWTPLLCAARNGHEAVVRLLLRTGKVNADSKDWQSRTPLWWAAVNGHEAIVKLLLETGKVDAASKDSNGQTLLQGGFANMNEAIVKLLLENGAGLESHDYSQELVSWAAENGHEAVVKLLLENGAEFESKNSEYGQTPLSLAAENGQEAVVKLLLENGAELESKDSKYSKTPLSLAAENGHKGVVKLLLEKGADRTMECKMAGVSYN